MKVFLLNDLVPKEVKENIKTICSADEMKLYDSYSVLSLECIPDEISELLYNEYRKYLKRDNEFQNIHEYNTWKISL